jgi:hypothetical protein
LWQCGQTVGCPSACAGNSIPPSQAGHIVLMFSTFSIKFLFGVSAIESKIYDSVNRENDRVAGRAGFIGNIKGSVLKRVSQ